MAEAVIPGATTAPTQRPVHGLFGPLGLSILGHFLRQRGSVLWAYRELTFLWLVLPTAAGLAVWQASGSLAGGLAVAAVTIVVPILPIPVIGIACYWIEGRVHVGRARRRRATFAQDWKENVTDIGWAQYDMAGGIKVPDLLNDDTSDPNVRRLQVRPLPRQNPATLASDLTGITGSHSARWEHNSDMPGTVNIALSSQPLPREIKPFAPTGQWDIVDLGLRSDWQRLRWVMSDIPHMLVVGKTMGGKGSVLRLVVLHGLVEGARVFIVNPKESGEFRWAEDIGVPVSGQITHEDQTVLETLDEVLKMVRMIAAEGRRRQTIIREMGLEDWTDLSDDLEPIILVIDEMSSLLQAEKGSSALAKEIRKLRETIGMELTGLVQRGRSAGIHLCVATQRPDVDTLGPNGGQLREQLDARVVMASIGADGRKMVLEGRDDPDIERQLDGTKGRCLATALYSGHDDVEVAQIAWTNPKTLQVDPRTDEPLTPRVVQEPFQTRPELAAVPSA